MSNSVREFGEENRKRRIEFKKQEIILDHENSLTDGLRLLLTVRQRMFVSILPTNQVREPSELIDGQNSRLHIRNNPVVILSI